MRLFPTAHRGARVGTRKSNATAPPLPFAEEAASLAALVTLASMTLPDTRAAESLRDRLALDPRGLALLRAGLGLLLALDACLRLCSAGALYADDGLLPRSIAVDLLPPLQWSLHLANGSLLFGLLLTAAQLLAALALTVGWRTRRSGALLWVLVVSAFARHPAVVDAGDLLALSLLSFGLFVPWNARWSVDGALAAARVDDDTMPASRSWAALALRAYVALIPAWIALVTLDAPAGLAGLLLSEHAHAPAAWLADALPGVVGIVEIFLRAAAFLVMALSLWPLRAGSVWASRVAAASMALPAILAVLLLHGGALPWLALLAASVLVDGAAWDRLRGRADIAGLRLHYDRDVTGARGLALLLREFLCLPRTQVGAAQDNPRAARLVESGRGLVVIDRDEQAHLDGAGISILLRRSPLLAPLRPLLASGLGAVLAAAALGLRRFAACLGSVGVDPVCAGSRRPRTTNAAVMALFAALVLLHASAAGLLPRGLGHLVGVALQPLGLDRSWVAALPAIDGTQRWVTVVGERLDGGEVDATDPRLPTADYAPHTPPWFAAPHARAYARALALPASTGARLALAEHVCARHSKVLARVRVTLMVRAADAEVAEQQVLLRHECGPEP